MNPTESPMADDPTPAPAQSDAEALARWVGIAQELENAHGMTVKWVDRREELYRANWQIPKGADPNLEYVPDTTPQFVGDRAIDKLVAQPYSVTVRGDLTEAMSAEVPPDTALDPEGMTEYVEGLKLAARKQADKKEATARGLMELIERQQGWSIPRALSYNTAIDAYAGPLRVAYDEDAQYEGLIPIFVQVLDPRSCYIVPDNRAGQGPKLVVYKRQARKQDLLDEGWDLLNDASTALGQLGLDHQMTVLDCWEKKRVREAARKGGKPGKLTCQVWHAIIVLGGDSAEGFLKEPSRMDRRGITEIPYSCRPVRRKPWMGGPHDEDRAKGFLDVFDKNWEVRCKLLSWQAQLVHQAVNPPKVHKGKQSQEIDLVTPGATNTIDTDESIEVPASQARPEIAQAWGMLENLTERGTFSAASFGQGVNQLSGIMTGRLQEAGEEPLGSSREALEGALGDLYRLVVMFARAYLTRGDYTVPLGATEAGPLDVSLFNGKEIWQVKLPGLSRIEAAQMAANFKMLSEPRSDGSRWVSDSTTRELSGLVPYEHLEEDRIRAEAWRSIMLDKLRAAQLQRVMQREQNVKDQMAQGETQINLQRELASAQQNYQQQQLNQPPPQGGPPPQGANPPGVPRTPVPSPDQQGMPMQHNPIQPQRGA